VERKPARELPAPSAGPLPGKDLSYPVTINLLPHQIHNFGLLVALILMWNFYVYQRLFDFYLKLVWHLWWSDLCWEYYVPLVLFGLVMNTLHLGLIVGTIKLQTKRPEDPQTQSEPVIQSHSRSQPELEDSVTIGDGPER